MEKGGEKEGRGLLLTRGREKVRGKRGRERRGKGKLGEGWERGRALLHLPQGQTLLQMTPLYAPVLETISRVC